MAIATIKPNLSYGGVFDSDPPAWWATLNFGVWPQVSASPFWQQQVPRPSTLLPASLFRNVVVVEPNSPQLLPVIDLIPVDEEDDAW